MTPAGKDERSARWTVEFYESAAEGSPVGAFLESLSFPAQVKVFNLIRLLEEQGVSLPFPYSSQITGHLREIRTQLGKVHLRILYCATPGRMFLLLHGFIKRAPRTPASAIGLANRRREEYLQRPG